MADLNAIVTPIPRREPADGPLRGVRLTIKDTFDTAGVRTTRGSRLFADHVPERNAEAVRRLVEAGAVPVGKTNTPEFALWWEAANLVFGRKLNPYDPDRTAGGSSGGDAVAVATGLSDIGLASDLGGSIRLPAHYCGVVGSKPTHGLISLEGHWPETLLNYWRVGTLTRTVVDSAWAFRMLAWLPGPANPWPRRIVGRRRDDATLLAVARRLEPS